MTTDTFRGPLPPVRDRINRLTDECAGETTLIFFAHPPAFAKPAEEDTGEIEDGDTTDPTRADR
ncbi:MAG: hypothetical protein IPJ30_07235 [Acidobacteria bacterium]|nr:hypothetical protein [Acidobacteriota bacterium]